MGSQGNGGYVLRVGLLANVTGGVSGDVCVDVYGIVKHGLGYATSWRREVPARGC
jgi:hypothetical protein